MGSCCLLAALCATEGRRAMIEPARQPIYTWLRVRGVRVLAHSGVPLNSLSTFARCGALALLPDALRRKPRIDRATDLFGFENAVALLDQLQSLLLMVVDPKRIAGSRRHTDNVCLLEYLVKSAKCNR